MATVARHISCRHFNLWERENVFNVSHGLFFSYIDTILNLNNSFFISITNSWLWRKNKSFFSHLTAYNFIIYNSYFFNYWIFKKLHETKWNYTLNLLIRDVCDLWVNRSVAFFFYFNDSLKYLPSLVKILFKPN